MRALVLSGGGVKSAYSAGCIKYLLGDLKNQYQIYAGVSSGAINCGFLAQFPDGQEAEAADMLIDLWSKLQVNDIYKRWEPFGRFHALWKNSFYDSSPLFNLIKKNISLSKIREVGKKIGVGAVSVSSGKYTTFTQDDNDFIEGVTASASFPVALKPINIRGQLWTDGGIKSISPLHTAIDLGATEIDLIITSPKSRIIKYINKPTIIDIVIRILDLSTDKIMANDIEKVYMHNKLAAAGIAGHKYIKLNILRPENNLIEDLLDFDPIKIREMIQKGYKDTKYKYMM
jgi:NTE family protein